MSPRLRAIAAVLICAAALFFAWNKYYEFINSGRRPPQSSLILNELEKSGVPDFTMQEFGREPISLSQFRGKIVIVNFWASWCEPCVTEFPSLQKLVAHFKDDIVMIAISGDYEESDIKTFIKAFKVSDPNIHITWDKDQEVAKKFGTFKLPESYLIGRKGELIRKVSGVDNWYSPEAISFFETLVKGEGVSPENK